MTMIRIFSVLFIGAVVVSAVGWLTDASYPHPAAKILHQVTISIYGMAIFVALNWKTLARRWDAGDSIQESPEDISD